MRDLSDFAEKDPKKDLENHYRRRFTARYKHPPVITAADEESFEWLQSELGQAKAVAIIDAYIKSNDKFVTDNGHSPKLIKSRINALIANAAMPRAVSQKQSLILKVMCGCSLCHKDFEWVGPPGGLESRKVCSQCSGKKQATAKSEAGEW